MQDSFYAAKITIRSYLRSFDDEEEKIEEIYEGKVKNSEGRLEMLYADANGKRQLISCQGKLFEKKELGSPFEPFRAEPGKEHDFVHRSPYGDFDLTCRCTGLEVSNRGSATEIKLFYYLLSGGEQIKRIRMTVKAERICND